MHLVLCDRCTWDARLVSGSRSSYKGAVSERVMSWTACAVKPSVQKVWHLIRDLQPSHVLL